MKSVRVLEKKKERKEKITMLTAHDAVFASLIDQCGIDVVLVGDSLAMVALGYESTVPVSMDEMIHHSKAVRRGVKDALLIGDMPFLSFQLDSREAILNAGRFMKEAGCDGVKIEGGGAVLATVEALVTAGIPVMGHIGLTPQSAGMLGGFRVQGRDDESATRLVAEAKRLEAAGVFSLVLECIPPLLAAEISRSLVVPCIGIGAGPYCDGQVLVTADLVGLYPRFTPRFARKYVDLSSQAGTAIARFKAEVENGAFPAAEHSFGPLTR